MSDWKEYRLGDVISIAGGFAYKGNLIGQGDNYLLGMGCVSYNDNFLDKGARPYEGDCPDRYSAKTGDIVLATRQQSDNLPILGMPAIIPSKYEGCRMIVGANLYKVEIKDNNFDNRYIYWLLKTPLYVNHIRSCQSGTTVRMITKANIEDFVFSTPSKIERKRIADIIWTLDDKIEVNKRINENLEQQAQALFKSWFVDFEPFKDQPFVESELGMIPQGWRVESLSSIADYVNGLAMQKYRPEGGEKGLPVLKIKELGQGNVDDSSESCSPSLIGEKYIINDGDIIFSWSGTLMVKIWCGGKCGLNQHLFVVNPKDYPKWFVYHWTKYHLDNFIRIAKDKAVTMGHIKRGELDKAKTVIPDNENMQKIDALMKPIFDQMIANELESHRLAELRDTLLPKLMSGELKVENVTF
jgi:type I restriction enzyme S subunit